VSPDASFTIVTVAFGTTAPVVSITVPLKVPVSCWPQHDATARKNTATTAATLYPWDANFDVIWRAPSSTLNLEIPNRQCSTPTRTSNRLLENHCDKQSFTLNGVLSTFNVNLTDKAEFYRPRHPKSRKKCDDIPL
jgi:hypothetical protein